MHFESHPFSFNLSPICNPDGKMCKSEQEIDGGMSAKVKVSGSVLVKMLETKYRIWNKGQKNR